MAKNSSELICKVCGKKFTISDSYNRHVAVCGIQFSDEIFEWKFVSIDQNEPPSEDCKDNFFENGTIETTREYLLSCDTRERQLKSKPNDHIKEKEKLDNNTKKLIECKECYRKFFYNRSLAIHMSKVHTTKSVRTKHSKKEPMVCENCSTTYKATTAFLRHVKNCKVQCSPTFEYAKCKKTILDGQNVTRHKNTIDRTERNGFQCAMCEKSFNRVDNYKRHLESCKNHLTVDSYICHYCGREFERKNTIRRHIFRKHWNLDTIRCENCGVRFRGISAKFSLQQHVKENHTDNTSTGNLKCLFCVKAFSSRDNILNHLIKVHDITFHHEHLAFSSLDQFKEWKTDMEKASLTFFRNRRGFTHSKKYSMSTYECHRSGYYQPKTDNRRRRMKLQGTKKIGSYCPAEIGLCINRSDSSCRVSFINMHLGHNVCDENELAYLCVPRDERAEIASKISNGISFDEILKEHTLTEKDRLYLLSRKDLMNISRAFNVKEKPIESYQVVNIESFIKRHEKSIIFLKRCDEPSSLHKGIFSKDDFFLVIMTEKQKDVLLKFGSKMICVDGSFTASNCDFLLLTLLTIDDYHECVPVAFALSNRNDFALVDVFLNCIRKETGAFSTKLLMSDVEFDYFEKWQKIMGTAENRPFCKWYVPKTWSCKWKKISDTNKRKQTRHRFYEIVTQLDKKLFYSKINEFFADTDPDLREFLDVLKSMHLEEIENWANCKRENVETNTNMHVESLNRKLKYLYGRLAASKTLTCLLTCIDGYLNINERQLKRKEIKGIVSPKLYELRRRHDECERNDVVVNIESIPDSDGGGWYVSMNDVGSDIAEVHFISECHDSCPGCKLLCDKCNTCAQKYRCTCMDNAMKNNMCKHIHALCIRLNDEMK